MKAKPKANPVNDERRQLEAAKTTRLRALRLAKEATEREEAAREAAANAVKPAKRRVRVAPQQDQLGSV